MDIQAFWLLDREIEARTEIFGYRASLRSIDGSEIFKRAKGSDLLGHKLTANDMEQPYCSAKRLLGWAILNELSFDILDLDIGKILDLAHLRGVTVKDAFDHSSCLRATPTEMLLFMPSAKRESHLKVDCVRDELATRDSYLYNDLAGWTLALMTLEKAFGIEDIYRQINDTLTRFSDEVSLNFDGNTHTAVVNGTINGPRIRPFRVLWSSELRSDRNPITRTVATPSGITDLLSRSVNGGEGRSEVGRSPATMRVGLDDGIPRTFGLGYEAGSTVAGVPAGRFKFLDNDVEISLGWGAGAVSWLDWRSSTCGFISLLGLAKDPEAGLLRRTLPLVSALVGEMRA